MDGTELDEILNGLETPEVETVAVETPAVETQPRDDTGKFAAKTDDQTPEVTDQDAQAEIEGGKGRVPVAAVQAEREKARTERNRADDLERQLAELRGSVATLTQQRQQPTPPVEKPKPKTFWESPDDFLSERLAPVQQSMQEAVQHQTERVSRLLAVQTHGQEKVEGAYQAMGEAIKADPNVTADLQRIMASEHPFDALVQWNDRRAALSEIGEDPAAYRERVRAELMAELGQTPPAAVTPSTTTKPLTKLPQSLSRLPGSGNGSGAIDASDAGIFEAAMAGR